MLWIALFAAWCVASVCSSLVIANNVAAYGIIAEDFTSDEFVQIESSEEKVNVGFFLEYFEDAEKQLTIKNVGSPPVLEQFKKFQGAVFNAGYSNSNYWLHFVFQIKDLENKEVLRYLEIDNTLLGDLEIYRRNSQGGFEVIKTGINNYAHPALIHYSSYLYPLKITSNERMEFFIKATSPSSLTVPVYLWHPDIYLQSKSDQRMFYGIMYGIMMTMCIYNLFLFLAIRESCYLFYSLYVMAILSIVSSYNGITAQYFLSNYPLLLTRSASISGLLAIYFSCQFTRGFLHVESYSPRIDLLFNRFSQLMLVIMPVLCVESIREKILPTSTSLPLIWVVISFWVGLLALKHKIREAKFYIAGWGVLLLSVMIFILSLFGVLPVGLYSEHGFKIGVVLESVIFAYALADRTHNMQRERVMLQKSVLQISERSNKIKDEFLATISHEFRTPMNGVLGALQMLRSVTVPREGVRYLEIANRSAADMMDIIDGILSFTEVRSGSLKVKKQQFGHLDLVTKIAWIYQKKFKEKGLKFETKFAAETDQLVIGDMEKVEQVLVQVLDNALKFTHEGSVSFEVTGSLSESGDEIGINYLVSDTGVGITEERREQVYEAFRQQDSSNTRAYGGLGIGLAISRRLLELMEGSISFSENDGGGTLFEIAVLYEIYQRPARQVQRGPGLKKTEIKTKPARIADNTKILVVEDNLVNQMILKSMLKKMGYQTLVAGNGREAVVLLEHETVDAILMDCQMPVMDGYETTREIRSMNNSNSNKPILAVTANVMVNDREKCLESGMNDYIKKPVSTEIIKEKLDHWLSLDHVLARDKGKSGGNTSLEKGKPTKW